MPYPRTLRLGDRFVRRSGTVNLLALDGADGADFRIIASQLLARIQNRVDVEAGRLRLSREFAQSLDQCFLDVVCEVVLGTKEDDTALRDCGSVSQSNLSESRTANAYS